LEKPVLKNVQELIESNYINGRPRHHLPSARDPNYTEGCSVFFIIDFPDFMRFLASKIHEIARKRHIVVENVPQEDFAWCRAMLSRFGNLSQLREIQGMCRPVLRLLVSSFVMFLQLDNAVGMWLAASSGMDLLISCTLPLTKECSSLCRCHLAHLVLSLRPAYRKSCMSWIHNH
jgi:hypothetical protein